MSNILLAQVYNCSDSTNSAYGASNYGTCETAADGGSSNPGTQTTTAGAPNTGFFQQVVSGGTFSILLPVAIAIILAIISTIIVRKKRTTNQSR